MRRGSEGGVGRRIGAHQVGVGPGLSCDKHGGDANGGEDRGAVAAEHRFSRAWCFYLTYAPAHTDPLVRGARLATCALPSDGLRGGAPTFLEAPGIMTGLPSRVRLRTAPAFLVEGLWWSSCPVTTSRKRQRQIVMEPELSTFGMYVPGYLSRASPDRFCTCTH